MLVNLNDYVGKILHLPIKKIEDERVYLELYEEKLIWLPLPLVEDNITIGDHLTVFIQQNKNGQAVVTTEIPCAQVDEFAFLRVASITEVGAFLSWGIKKDLFVPFKEQDEKMQENRSYLVRVLLDNQNRIMGSSRLNRFVSDAAFDLQEKQTVDLIIAKKTPIGFKAIINNEYWGLLYDNEIFSPVKVGHRCKGVIKTTRPDGRVDLRLKQDMPENRDNVAEKILLMLNNNHGFLSVSDRSSPDEIKALFGVSKRIFKQAIGRLYKEKKIILERDGIRVI